MHQLGKYSQRLALLRNPASSFVAASTMSGLANGGSCYEVQYLFKSIHHRQVDFTSPHERVYLTGADQSIFDWPLRKLLSSVRYHFPQAILQIARAI